MSDAHVLSVNCSGTNVTKIEPEESSPKASHLKTHNETAAPAVCCVG